MGLAYCLYGVCLEMDAVRTIIRKDTSLAHAARERINQEYENCVKDGHCPDDNCVTDYCKDEIMVMILYGYAEKQGFYAIIEDDDFNNTFNLYAGKHPLDMDNHETIGRFKYAVEKDLRENDLDKGSITWHYGERRG